MVRRTVWILVVLMQLEAGWVSGQGLFPSLDLSDNFALETSVEATSSCSEEEGGGCEGACLHGDELPPAVDLLQLGIPGSGVVSLGFGGGRRGSLRDNYSAAAL